MSSNSNHINPIITLDNYEEYFILYMDNELNESQVQMVEDFLQNHPQLQPEFDMLMETKLPAEEISFDKTALLSDYMKDNSIQEDLLLFIDNELKEDKKKLVQFELDANPAYHQQYQQLLRTKLDPSEEILHPHKKELYRHERRVIAFSVWMRIAAAFILIAALSILYYLSKSETLPAGAVAVKPSITQPSQNEHAETPEEFLVPQKEMAVINKVENHPGKENNSARYVPVQPSYTKAAVKEKKSEAELMAVNRANEIYPGATAEQTIVRTSSIELPKQSFNTKVVTMDHVDPYNNITGSIQPAVYVENPVNNNDNKKGSLKAFLRKATRFVEKRTGIDPSNGDDELLIGAVALKL